jgi:hypothetical protein
MPVEEYVFEYLIKAQGETIRSREFSRRKLYWYMAILEYVVL